MSAGLTHQEGSVLGQEAVQGAAAGPAVEPQHQRVSRRIVLRLYKPGGGESVKSGEPCESAETGESGEPCESAESGESGQPS